MPNLNYVCTQIVSRGQQNELYKNVHVLRCDSPHGTRCNLKFPKAIRECVFYQLSSVANSWIAKFQCNKLMLIP